jgi:hypothetical protein
MLLIGSQTNKGDLLSISFACTCQNVLCSGFLELEEEDYSLNDNHLHKKVTTFSAFCNFTP